MWVKIYSPTVKGIEVVKRAEKRARRARLYYMRKPKHDKGSVQGEVGRGGDMLVVISELVHKDCSYKGTSRELCQVGLLHSEAATVAVRLVKWWQNTARCRRLQQHSAYRAFQLATRFLPNTITVTHSSRSASTLPMSWCLSRVSQLLTASWHSLSQIKLPFSARYGAPGSNDHEVNNNSPALGSTMTTPCTNPFHRPCPYISQGER